MKTILVTGASGLVGRALCLALEERGHRVRKLLRSGGDVHWDLTRNTLAPGALDGVDCVVHLAGEPIAQRWTATAKQRILESRVRGTALLAREILGQQESPDFICASGINVYGYDVAESVDESSDEGAGFLAHVCREWEAAAAPLEAAGIRTVHVRTGIVLSAEGGALAKMLLPFKLGLGGKIGSGEQSMSWIGLPDLIAIYTLAIENAEVSGPINAVAPEPVTNATFTQVLGKVIKRPAILPLPASAVRLLFGQMGTETVLANIGVLPKRLQQLGFKWQAPRLEDALTICLL